MKAIPFKKMHGSGNDFILVDNRQMLIPHENGPELARKLCKRGFGIGADGLILIETSQKADFKWHFLNADGSLAEMCGNGGRCAARFAHLIGICSKELSFETLAGIIKAYVDNDTVKLQLTKPKNIQTDIELKVNNDVFKADFVDTGVPHAVLFFQDLDEVDVVGLGRKIRYHRFFEPNGTNVNFVQVESDKLIRVRTYERGVENETYACGTGAAASVLMSGMRGLVSSPVEVITSGGERLVVHFDLQRLEEIYLEGKAVLVYSGITEEVFG